MKIQQFPIILFSGFFGAGIIASNFWQPSITVSLIFCLCAALLVGFLFLKSKKDFIQQNHFGYASCLAMVSFGILTHTLHTDTGFQNHYTNLQEHERNTIIGTISERIKPNAYVEKYYFQIEQVNEQKCFGKILLTLPKKEVAEPMISGTQLLIYGSFEPIPKAVNPFQFDYASHLEKQNIFHQLKLHKRNYKNIRLNKNFDYYVQLCRDGLLKSFEVHHFPKATNEVLHALLLGQRQDMDAKTAQEYTDSGVIHILAISGLHIAILYAMLITLIAPLEHVKKGKLIQFLLALLFLWGFAVLSGLSASVVRSVVMFSFISWGKYLGKSANNYNSLAVSILVILLCKPNFLFDVGFQLSYAAVFSIMWLYPMVRKFTWSRYKLVRYFLELLMLSLVAQIGVLPISLFYFKQFPTLFLLANVVVIPLSSFILIYGIFVLLLNFVWLKAALFFGKLLCFATTLMNEYIGWVASFSDFTLKNIAFNASLLLASYLVIVTLTRWFQQRDYSRSMQLLCCCFLLQLSVLVSFQKADDHSELLIFNNRYSTLITEKYADSVHVYTNDTTIATNKNLQNYLTGHFTHSKEIRSLKNVAFFNNRKILVMDSTGAYPKKAAVDVLILIQSPKINMERLLTEIRPREIVADGSNYKSYVNRWKVTCEKEKIPFHATAEKGFYRIN